MLSSASCSGSATEHHTQCIATQSESAEFLGALVAQLGLESEADVNDGACVN